MMSALSVESAMQQNLSLQDMSKDIHLSVNSLVEQAANLEGIKNALDCLKQPEFQFLAPLFPLFSNLSVIPAMYESVKTLQATVNRVKIFKSRKTKRQLMVY